MKTIRKIWRKILSFFGYRANLYQRYNPEYMRYSGEVVAAVHDYPERGHFVGARTIQDCLTFARMLEDHGIHDYLVASLNPKDGDGKVSYAAGMQMVRDSKLKVFIGVTSAMCTGWSCDGYKNSIHCLHEIYSPAAELQFLSRMRYRSEHTGGFRNFVNGRFK